MSSISVTFGSPFLWHQFSSSFFRNLYYRIDLTSPTAHPFLLSCFSRGSIFSCCMRAGREQLIHPFVDQLVSLIPLAVEVLGFWDKEIKSLGCLQVLCLGLDPKESTKHLFQKLSVTPWHGNSHLWVTRFPIPPPQVDKVLNS